jgi:hypothetical protein
MLAQPECRDVLGVRALSEVTPRGGLDILEDEGLVAGHVRRHARTPDAAWVGVERMARR